MAIAITLRGFNDLGRSVTPFDGLFSLPFFYILRKYEEIYQVEVLIFCKSLQRIPFT